MKNIFLSMLVIALAATPAAYANGNKKETKKKAKIECTKSDCCDKKACPKDAKCTPLSCKRS